jgi:hypothetical protein
MKKRAGGEDVGTRKTRQYLPYVNLTNKVTSNSQGNDLHLELSTRDIQVRDTEYLTPYSLTNYSILVIGRPSSHGA